MKKNLYTCDGCMGRVVTIDRDQGTTPYMIACRARKDCDGTMYSHFYPRKGMEELKPQFEWYRPGRFGRFFIRDSEKRHVDAGGLLLRRIRRW